MFEESVDLEEIRLTSSTGSLEVSATSKAFFKSSSVSSLSCQSYPANFKPDHVWVTRGSRCALDLRVFFNNQKLQSHFSFPFIEKLGYSALVAELWSRLSLRTFLNIPRESRSRVDNPDFSISIIPARSDASIDSCIYETINITPLNMIPDLSLEKIEIRLQINVKRPKKKVKLSQTGPDHNGGKVQEILPVSWDKEQPSHLPYTLRVPLNSSFETQHCHDSICWKLKQSPSHQISHEHTESSLSYEDWTTVANKPLLPLFNMNQKTSNKAWQYPIQKIQEFDGRFESLKRLTFIPSPSTQVHFLQSNDGLTYEMQKKIKLEFLADEQEMLFTKSCVFQNTDKTRSSKLTQNHPSDPTRSSSSSLEEKDEDIFNFSSTRGIQIQNEASEMLQIVLNLLVTGKFGREPRKNCSYKLETPYPKKSLAKLVPSVFAVGFSWSVAINFQYLSTIANAMSNSLTRNCLSPSLQKKLSHIASLTYREDLATSATERLYNTLYMSLWGMTQNKLNEQPNRQSQSRSPVKYSDGHHVKSSQVSLSSNQKDLNFFYEKDHNDEENAENEFHESLWNDLNDPDLLNEELEKKELRYRPADSFISRKDVQTFCSRDEDLLFDTAVEEDSMLI